MAAAFLKGSVDGDEMKSQRETLGRDLSQAAELLHKYGHHGQFFSAAPSMVYAASLD